MSSLRILDFAPNLSVPPMDGGDKRSWCLYKGLVENGNDCYLICKNGVYHNLDIKEVFNFERKGGKLFDALCCFIKGRNYWSHTQVDRIGFERIKKYLHNTYDVTVVNFLHNLSFLEYGRNFGRIVVDTHNYDPDCFEYLSRGSRNPILKILCNRAAAESIMAVRSLPEDSILLSVSEEDRQKYIALEGRLRHYVVPNGSDKIWKPRIANYQEKIKKLIFVGSLSAKMNQDALLNFKRNIWGSIRHRASMTVVGSRPNRMVVKLCQEENWRLKKDLTECELEQEYMNAHFAVLPFGYGAGSKLKLIEACCFGIPVLSTRTGSCGMSDLPKTVTTSDDPRVWLDVIEREDFSDFESDENGEFRNNYNWKNLATQMSTIFENEIGKTKRK